jgi:endonuclease YncB( thermonuclease family)
MMFLPPGLMSAIFKGAGLVLAAAAFAFAFAGEAPRGPVMADRGEVPATIAEPDKPSPYAAVPGKSRYLAEVLRISDGDTFEARVQVWPGIAITTLVRLRGIDTPELRARCPEERMKAEAARAALAKILAEGGVEIGAVTLDKYGGRVDADASTRSTPDVSSALLRAGMARHYAGGQREGWCS